MTAQAITAPEHEQLAVRDIDDAHDAEHQRQPQRHEGQGRGGHQPFEYGQEQVRSEGQGV